MASASAPKQTKKRQRNLSRRDVLLILFFLGIPALPFAYDRLAWAGIEERAAKIRVGMTEAEVLAIMGPPPRRASPNRWNKDEWDQLWYTSPLARDFFGECITVYLDPHRVIRVDIAPGHSIPFDRAEWHRSAEGRRGYMFEDLVRRHEFRGMTRRSVIELLGSPDDPEDGGKEDSTIAYWGGTARRNFSPIPWADDIELRLFFDEQGRVDRWRIQVVN